MKNLFDPETFAWTDVSRSVDREIQSVLQPIYDKYVEEGYSPREISYLVSQSIAMIDAMKCLRLRRKNDKEEENAK